jgi:hypothetical protein
MLEFGKQIGATFVCEDGQWPVLILAQYRPGHTEARRITDELSVKAS